jgi:DNA-binding NtrC family response regulator
MASMPVPRIMESPFAEIVFLNSSTKASERTGALQQPIDRFEAVNGGTVVLDEIGVIAASILRDRLLG